MSAVESNTLVKMTEAEAIALLASQDVGRLIFTRRAEPAVIPLNYTLAEDAIWVCTVSRSALAPALRGAVVAFEVDEVDRGTHTGWSVVVLGTAELVAHPDKLARAPAPVPEPWVAGRAEHLLRIPLTRVTGRRIVQAA